MEHIGPGPIDPSLLRLQDQHVSTKVWNGFEYEFRARYNFWDHLPDERVQQVIRQTAFHHILDIGAVDINNHLITALIERWRPETHTFHLPCGECTVTLEDVAVQLGIPINGQVVTGSTSLDWENVCLNLLGAVPPRNQMKGQRIKLTWLESTFSQLPPDTNEEVIIQHARAFIMRMICGFLIPDTSGNQAHLMYLPLLEDLPGTHTYSWGSAVLAHLYRGLSRAALLQDTSSIGGCMLLLQSWAYDRIPIIAPRLKNDSIHYFPLLRRWSTPLTTTNIPGHASNIIRALLDRLRIDEFVWTPYTWMNIPEEVHPISRARVPMICFAAVAWHAVDRVKRQFGFQQSIPDDAPVLDELYKKDLRGKPDVYWPQRHATWINCWHNWEHYLINGLPAMHHLYHFSEYMQWYIQRTRRYISHDGAYSTGGFAFAKQINDWTNPPQAWENPYQTINNCKFASRGMMEALAELNPTAFSLNFTEAASTQQFNMPEYEDQDQGQQPNAETNVQSPQYQQEYQVGGFAQYTSQFSFSHAASSSHQFQEGSSSQWYGSAPSMFAANLNTPMSAIDPGECYRPTMPSSSVQHGNNEDDDEDDQEEEEDDDEEEEDDEEDDDEEEDEEEEEMPQLIRPNRRRTRESPERVEPQIRIQPPRLRNPPRCGTSSHTRRP